MPNAESEWLVVGVGIGRIVIRVAPLRPETGFKAGQSRNKCSVRISRKEVVTLLNSLE